MTVWGQTISESVFSLLVFFSMVAQAQSVDFRVSVNKDSAVKISPYIYGTNQLLDGVSGGENWTAYRLGGNRLTGYNWENNASNAGSDYYQSSDDYLEGVFNVPKDSSNVPGSVTSAFQNQAIQLGAFSLVTLQMAGFVAKDKNGIVDSAQTAPSPRWAYEKFHKSSPLSLVPDTSDDSVFMDEYVNFLMNKFGPANNTTGVKAFALDNEPSLWYSTHPRLHPDTTTCAEITSSSAALAAAVKDIDPTALIFGPALYGFNAYLRFQDAPDWQSVSAQKGYGWFIDYYLDKMKQASDSAGKRLLDVLDLHWYPEAVGDNKITDRSSTTAKDYIARVEAPRTLWDPTYAENSWIAHYYRGYLPLIPRVMQSINKYYPGTKLGFTEFNYGGENDISGALAIADVLGIFGKYGVYFATFWQLNSQSSFISAAYRMYRDYDGNNSTFGDYYVPSQTSDPDSCSIYGSVDDGDSTVHIIVINKSTTQRISGNFTVSSSAQVVSGKVWQLNRYNSQIHQLADVAGISDNSFSYPIASETVTQIVLRTATVPDQVVTRKIPEKFALGVYPNPFNPGCRIEYDIPDNSVSGVRIYSVNGVLIRTFSGLGRTGVVYWDGTNENHEKVASGVYFAVLRNSGHLLAATKMLLLK
jgi:mannan endo-1,4-beta-mannosidase